ncbi:MAG: hypothetical protein WCJ84_04075 [Candidatus Peregrinibacteria bacterium]
MALCISFFAVGSVFVSPQAGLAAGENATSVGNPNDPNFVGPPAPQQSGAGNNTDITLEQPFLEGHNTISTKDGALSILQQYMSQAFTFFAGLTALIAVLVMIGAGFMLMFSAGDSSMKDSAKTMITESLGGLSLLFLAGLILHTVNPNFFTFSGDSNLGSPTQSTAAGSGLNTLQPANIGNGNVSPVVIENTMGNPAPLQPISNP